VHSHLPVCKTLAPEQSAKHWFWYVLPLTAHTKGPPEEQSSHEIVVAAVMAAGNKRHEQVRTCLSCSMVII
jgi:hypothetical protein